MTLDLRQLRYFVAVAEEENVGRAAARLHLSQSPLSRQVKQLEDRLGLALFERARKRVRLTGAGREFLGHARGLLAHAEGVERLARMAARGEAGALAVGFVQGAVYDGGLPAAARRFRAACPEVRLELHAMRSGAQREALAQGRLDVGFVHTPPPDGDPALASRLLSEDRFVLLLPDDHPAAGAPTVTPRDLDGQPFVAPPRDRDPAFRDRLLRACAEHGFVPDIRHEAADEATIFGLVAAGVGLSLAQGGLRAAAPRGVTLRELPGFPLSVRVHLVWRRGTAEPVVGRFLAAAAPLGDAALDPVAPA